MKINDNCSKASLRTDFNSNFLELIICLLIIIATLAVYWQIQEHEFINFDDNEYIYENEHVQQGITLEGTIWAFTAYHSNNWHPLTWLSHMLDVELFGLNPGWHHLINLFLHITNTLLLYFVLRFMTGSIWKSGFVAALFALHPLHVESVAWASERKDVLSTFFWMLTLLGYFWYVKRPLLVRYVLVGLFFILGLLSKPMVVTLPFVLLLLDYWPLKRLPFESEKAIQWRKVSGLLWEKMPFFFFIPISAYFTYSAQTKGGVVKTLELFSLGARISNALVAYVNYILKMFFPFKLAVIYPHPGIYSWWQIVGAGFFIMLITVFAVRSMKNKPYFITGWLWFLGTLIPVIGLVQVGMQSMADRYTYIPYIGLFIIIAWGVPDLTRRFRYKRFWLPITALLILLTFMGITWNQVGYWVNSETLYKHSINITSNNFIFHALLGRALLDEGGRTDEGIEHYFKAVRIYPDYLEAHHNLAIALDDEGRTDEAIYHYLETLRIDPDFSEGYNNLGIAYIHKGDKNSAIACFRKAVQLNSDNILAKINLKNAIQIKNK